MHQTRLARARESSRELARAREVMCDGVRLISPGRRLVCICCLVGNVNPWDKEIATFSLHWNERTALVEIRVNLAHLILFFLKYLTIGGQYIIKYIFECTSVDEIVLISRHGQCPLIFVNPMHYFAPDSLSEGPRSVPEWKTNNKRQ